MGLFYKAKPKEILEIRNKIFLESGVPALIKNGFKRSPFSTAWFGRDNYKDFSYELCRFSGLSQLEIISVYIIRGESWIQIHLNIFELKPNLESLEQLNGLDGMQFGLPPNSISKIRLRIDNVKGMSLFDLIFGEQYKLGSYYSKNGLNRRIEELSKLIEKDMNNIDNFIKRWLEMHQPNLTTWEGHKNF